MAETQPTPERLCEQCRRRPVPPSRGTKPRRYCSRSCVQRAYEQRRQQLVVAAALELERERGRQEMRALLRATEAGRGKSREDEPAPAATSREDAADQQERPGRKSREVPGPESPEGRKRPRSVVELFKDMPPLRGGW